MIFKMIFKFCVFFAFCIYKISCETVSMDEAVKRCLPKYNMNNTHYNLPYFLKYGVFAPEDEDKKCVFHCVLEAIDILDSNFVVDRQKTMDFSKRQFPKTNSTRAAESLDLIFEKCLPPKNTSSPCDTVYSIATCAMDIVRISGDWLSPLSGHVELQSIKEAYSKNAVPVVNFCKRLKLMDSDLF